MTIFSACRWTSCKTIVTFFRFEPSPISLRNNGTFNHHTNTMTETLETNAIVPKFSRSATQAFLLLLKTSLGIIPIIPGSSEEASLANSDLTRNLQTAHVAQDIERFHLLHPSEEPDDSDDEGVVKANFGWSNQAQTLGKLIQNRENWKMTYMDSLCSFFMQLALKGLRIDALDNELGKFVNLTELNVSNNNLKKLANIPPNVRVLHAYDNEITEISITGNAVKTLEHLGLGFNNIEDLSEEISLLENCISLDLSFNSLSSIKELTNRIESMPKLAMLHVQGNPLCFYQQYGTHICSKTNLEMIDGNAVEQREQMDIQTVASSCSLTVVTGSVSVNAIRELKDDEREKKEDQNGDCFLHLEIVFPDGTHAVCSVAQPLALPPIEKAKKKDQQDTAAHSEEMTFDLNFKSSFSFVPTVAIRDSLDLEGLVIRTYVIEEGKEQKVNFGTSRLRLSGLLHPQVNGHVSLYSICTSRGSNF